MQASTGKSPIKSPIIISVLKKFSKRLRNSINNFSEKRADHPPLLFYFTK